MEKIKSLNLKGHLLTAISYMIPIVCGGGFLVAIGMAFGGTNMYSDGLVHGSFTFWDALATMGGAALGLLPLIIAVGIAFSIAGKPGIASWICSRSFCNRNQRRIYRWNPWRIHCRIPGTCTD